MFQLCNRKRRAGVPLPGFLKDFINLSLLLTILPSCNEFAIIFVNYSFLDKHPRARYKPTTARSREYCVSDRLLFPSYGVIGRAAYLEIR